MMVTAALEEMGEVIRPKTRKHPYQRKTHRLVSL